MGLGVVGGGVARILNQKAESLTQQVGCPLVIKRILVRDPAKKRSLQVDPELLTTNAKDIIADPDIDVVVEVIGGESPALEFIRESLLRGKHVVTANKEVIAKHGRELLALAHQHGVDILYEASVGAGIPLIGPLKQGLLANHITAIRAIINGTTNYILTRMSQEGMDFSAALRQAQELGYAEADPTNDVEGIDAAYKLAILATLAFHTEVRPQDIYHEGITRLTARDFRYAKELGYAIKLLAIAKETNNSIEVRIHPTLIPEELLLAKVDGVFNAVQFDGDLIGRLLFYGKGAGDLPTTSAVVADLIDLAQKITRDLNSQFQMILDTGKSLKPFAEIETRYYMRMSVADHPGVLARIAKILGDNNISIASVIQKEADASAQTAEIVIMTHPALELAMQTALGEMAQLHLIKEIGNFVRVET